MDDNHAAPFRCERCTQAAKPPQETQESKGWFFSVVEEEKKEGERTAPQLQHAALILAFH